jgi:hypothetical protein
MRKLNDRGFANLIPMVLTIVIVFALLFIGGFINGTIHQELVDTMPAAASRSVEQNDTLNTMGNVSVNWDTGIDIVQVVIIITLLAGAIGAIFLFTRFRM